ncbi:ATP-binding protein [Phocaeicola dorei]|uniref:ATP-binding protein n=1 Tax=Phocaeicola dorei TaxID=357276 RepID=UPI00189C4815|nr:ATP-binding protein [Phocaeicola dorei]
MTFLLEYIKQKGECLNIGELFEYMIVCSIKAAIEAHKGIQNTESIRILLQRLLEKMAFVMEISRKDQISKDELYTILDGIKGNMTQMFIANFDLLYFESRILKDTDGTLQFENTELQEYLAAKELCRQDDIESVLYDVAVHKELKHIYPNWYDVIPHISYSKDRIHTFINVFRLIISYESNLENVAFENLLKYVDPSVLSIQQKEELFSIIFEHYQRIPAYIMWKSSMSNLLQKCYTINCDSQIILSHDKLNKIQLSNVTVTLDAIVEVKKHSDGIYNYWRQAANYLMGTDDNENKLAALNLYNALKCVDELIQLSESYSYFTKKLKEKYCEVTGYMRIADNRVVDCWLNDCYISNPYAINAVLYIEDLPTLIYAYSKIIEDGKLCEFFNEKGSLAVFYDLHLKSQFDIAWKGNTENKELITRIITSFISNQSYTTHSEINAIIKQILFNETTGQLFIKSFDGIWDLEDLFRRFDAELIDIELISSLDKSLSEAHVEPWYINDILTNLINKIRKDKDKKDSIAEYVERYADTFKRWDEESIKTGNKKTDSHNQQLIKAYEVLSDANVSQYDKYEAVNKLSDNIEFVKAQNTAPLIDIIKAFFDELDLDKMILERKTHNSFTLPWALPKIPAFIKVLYHLGINDLLNRYRITLAKTLPYFCVTRNYDTNEIRDIYKSVIGSISDDEKQQLVKWWKDRKDDFMNISSDDICMCITDYSIDALYYKLEEYVEQYIEHTDLDHSIAAAKALDIISNGDYGWNIGRYRKLFSLLEDESITSVKMQCNEIMIEKFQDSEAITWRINYLKNNVIRSSHNETGEFRPISQEEAEIISTKPYMFRCFMRIKENEALAEQMLNLFDFGLKLCVNSKTQQYAYYLLNQIYHFFVDLNKIHYISMLREKVEKLNKKNVSYLATNIMNLNSATL